MKKIIQKFFQMLLNHNGKSNLNQSKTKTQETIKYFEAKMFYNDLNDPENYYLKVSSNSKNVFVRKDEVTNGNIYKTKTYD